MFTSGMQEMKDNTVTFNDLDPVAFEFLLKFLYIGEIGIQAYHLLPLLHTADYLQVNELKNKCMEFLKNNVDKTNCCSLLIATKQNENYSSELFNPLRTKCLELLTNEFHYIIEVDEDFLKLDYEFLKGVLARDELSGTEENIYKATLRWIKKHSSLSLSEREELWKLIRFPFITPSFLGTINPEEIEPESVLFLKLQNQALRYSHSPHSVPLPSNVKPRKSQIPTQINFFCSQRKGNGLLLSNDCRTASCMSGDVLVISRNPIPLQGKAIFRFTINFVPPSSWIAFGVCLKNAKLNSWTGLETDRWVFATSGTSYHFYSNGSHRLFGNIQSLMNGDTVELVVENKTLVSSRNGSALPGIISLPQENELYFCVQLFTNFSVTLTN